MNDNVPYERCCVFCVHSPKEATAIVVQEVLFCQNEAKLCSYFRPVTVVSTMDMTFVDTSFPTAAAVTRRRARSLPVRRKECSQFVRFRSLRDSKPERRDRRRPFRVEVVSIASSAESKLRRRRTMRERARQRLENQARTLDIPRG
ncbi:hypothetical protein GCK32_018081 [Trichostrongylus colubriformis]|uniref:Uncharacterized protein n=1 Tax=Trichostrongylus colubriformis TaxID=6319 RepID=A0AAN8G4J8_TRICO